MTNQPTTQLENDIVYLFTTEHYLRVLKQLEIRRDSIISTFSNADLSPTQLAQISGEIRAVNETMALLGYYDAKKMDRFKLL